MQVRISDENQELATQYVELCRKVLPTFHISDVMLVNSLLTDKLRQEIERTKKKLKDDK